MLDWQPIETAPDKGHVLVAWHSPAYREWMIRSAYMLAGKAYHQDSVYGGYYAAATHWMEQPAPPADGVPPTTKGGE